MPTENNSQRQIEREARDIRIRGVAADRQPGEIVDDILAAIPGIHPLMAWRLANGWARSELAARIDNLYEQDGLEPPRINETELYRFEHGNRRPGAERLDYLCRVYRTRPDKLGFGRDYSEASVTHLERAGLVDLFPATATESQADLVDRVRKARTRVNLFGLTRNYYARDAVLPVLSDAANRIPVRLYIMDPASDSRRDRYRIEPAEAAMEQPERYMREILGPLREAAANAKDMKIFLYNFPVSFAIEEVDSAIRVMLYGHGKRGTEGPILVWGQGTPYYDYFASQLRWLEQLAAGPAEPWRSKEIRVRELDSSN